jgi:hypothetical protein
VPVTPSPYDVIRAASYGVALIALPATFQLHVPGRFTSVPIDLREIDGAALTQWDSLWRGKFSWDWRRIDTTYKSLRDDRFEVAVWSGPILCGLAAGAPRYGRMEVDVMQGSPNSGHPLKGAVRFAVLEAARAYTLALGHTQLRLQTPNPGMLTKYQLMGFTLEPPLHPYCWMNVP